MLLTVWYNERRKIMTERATSAQRLYFFWDYDIDERSCYDVSRLVSYSKTRGDYSSTRCNALGNRGASTLKIVVAIAPSGRPRPLLGRWTWLSGGSKGKENSSV